MELGGDWKQGNDSVGKQEKIVMREEKQCGINK